jgi:hypothetical protein
MSNDNTNTSELKPLVFDAKKAIGQRIKAVEMSKNIDTVLQALTAPIMPSFGGKEVVTCLAFMQSYKSTIVPAMWENSKHFVQYVKGGEKLYIPVMDGEKQAIGRGGNPVFDLQIKDGQSAFKKERILLQKAEKGDTIHKILVDFAASDIEKFSNTLGQALQAAELSIFQKLLTGTKILKSRKPLTVALQIGTNVVSTSFVADNSIDSKYLTPSTYEGKTAKEQADLWSEFCKNVYQSLKRAMTAGEVLKLNDAYKKLMGI